MDTNLILDFLRMTDINVDGVGGGVIPEIRANPTPFLFSLIGNKVAAEFSHFR
jgi:hypothetical protein